MTTIAFDGTTLACDAMATVLKGDADHCKSCGSEAGRYKQTTKLKIVKSDAEFRGSKIIAVTGAGNSALLDDLKNIAIAGKDLERILTDTFECFPRLNWATGTLVILTAASCWELEIQTRKVTIKEITDFPYACGSGHAAARLAMSVFGCSPIDAISAAALSDPNTGGKVYHTTRDGSVETSKLLDRTAFLAGLPTSVVQPTPVMAVPRIKKPKTTK